MATLSVKALAEELNLSYSGAGDHLLTHATGLEGEDPHGLSYVENNRWLKKAQQSKVKVLICTPDTQIPDKILLYSETPAMDIVAATKLLHPMPRKPVGIHPTLCQGQEVSLGKDLHIGEHVVIGNCVKIGDRTVIESGVVIQDDCVIGQDCEIHPNVTIRHETLVGNRVVINAGAVLGAEGYGFVTHQGVHHKIPQVGHVVIEDDVEIGANNTIDRGRFGVTRVGRGTKLDNLVHLGHNVEIGEHSLIVGMVGFAGSTKTGHHLTMGGQSMMAGHLKVGNHVVVQAKSCLAKDVGDGGRYAGIPARPYREWLKANGWLYRLGEVFADLKAIKQRLGLENSNEAGE